MVALAARSSRSAPQVKKMITIRVPYAVLAAVNRAAERAGVSQNVWCQRAIGDLLAEEGVEVEDEP